MANNRDNCLTALAKTRGAGILRIQKLQQTRQLMLDKNVDYSI